MATHLYWRFYITAANLGNNGIGSAQVSIAEVVYYDSSNNVISTSGGVVSASSQNGTDVATKAFDGNGSTWWSSANPVSSGSPEWLQVQFASPVSVDHFSLTFTGGTPNASPANFSLQFSDGTTWTTLYSYEGAMRMTGSYTNTFYTTGIVYRLSVTAIQSGTDSTIASGVKLYDASNNVVTGILGNGFALSYDGGGSGDGPNPTQAYNNPCSSWFRGAAGAPSVGSPWWIGWQFPAGTADATALSFVVPNLGATGIADTPAAGSLLKSTDGVTFTNVLDFAVSPALTANCQTYGPVSTLVPLVAQPFVWFVF